MKICLFGAFFSFGLTGYLFLDKLITLQPQTEYSHDPKSWSLESLNDLIQINKWKQQWCPTDSIPMDSVMACKLPQLDPFDPTLKKFFTQNSRSFNCRQVQPYYTYVDEENYLHINMSEFNETTNEESPVECEFQTFDQANDSDKVVIFHQSRKLRAKHPQLIETDYVKVNCNQGNFSIYSNLHAIVRKLDNKTFGVETDQQLSVVIFMLDSTSLSMFQRKLPDFYRYLTNDLKSFVMRGFNKVADNTFVNMIPMLTGKRVFRADKGMPSDFNFNPRRKFMNDLGLIWQNFSQLGYVTHFDEDRADIHLFNFNLKGFREKPVDHYYRPYWLTVDRNMTNLTFISNIYCLGNTPKLSIQLDIIRRMQQRYKGQLKFSLTFFNDLTHEYDNDLSKADVLLTTFFRNLQPHLNRTLLIVASDHGHRFSSIRKTLVGLLEERLPFLSLTLPQWFLQNNPTITANLRANQHRLSTHFDVYETLKDVLNANFNGPQKPCGTRGLSLLYEIPKNRTCQMAGIPQHFCTCSEFHRVNINETVVKNASEFLVDKLNILLSEYKDLCAQLHSPTLLHAEEFSSNDKLVHGYRGYKENQTTKNYKRTNNLQIYRISVSVEPSAAEFEALVQHNNVSDKFSLVGSEGEISRINKYGNQSACIKHSTVRKFCFCR